MQDNILYSQKHYTEALLESLAKKVASTTLPGDIIFLYGDLGTGKTTFSRYYIRSLLKNNALHIASPTFSLLQTYMTDSGELRHYDLYRLSTTDDVFDLGFEDNIEQSISLIEWPQLIENIDYPHILKISLEHETPSSRIITLSSSSPRWRHFGSSL